MFPKKAREHSALKALMGLIVAFLVLAGRSSAAEEEPLPLPDNIPQGMEMDVFYAKDCKHCKRIEKELFALMEKRGAVVFRHEVSEKGTGRLFLAMQSMPEFEAATINSDGDMPLVFIGRYVLEGQEDLTLNLSRVIDLGDSTLFEAPHKRVPEDLLKAAPTVAGKAEINLAYFENPGCPNCGTTTFLLSVVKELQPGLKVTRFDINKKEDRLLLEAVCRKTGVPERKRLVTPAVFVGEDYLLERFDRADLLAVVGKYASQGAKPYWDDIDTGGTGQEIIARFRAMGTIGIALAGLVDGINPCAFATIVFMVIYLTGIGMSRRKVLVTGVAFSAGVFVAYFGMGAGALTILGFLKSTSHVRECTLGAGALTALAFGILSLRDYLITRKKGLKAGTLRLSDDALGKIRAAIARFARSRWVIFGAVITGFVVSLTEVVCTGQMYLPTIVFVSHQSETRLAGLAALLLYNVAFMIPMLVIFAAVFMGARTETLTRLTQRHLAKAKLALAIVFVALGGVLGVMLLP
jgi:cytochrome c biogenesis protein CcdA